MNIEQAKTIPIADILEKLGRSPKKQKVGEIWFLAPWRDERTPSLHVHIKNNWWYDFGEGIGGDAIALVQKHLRSNSESCTIADALRWLNNMVGVNHIKLAAKSNEHFKKESKLKLKSVKPLSHPALVNYLDSRGIPSNVAVSILKELQVLNVHTGKTITALGLFNEEEGYELRNPFFKSSVGQKAISFIRGSQIIPAELHIFEGMMDYLSVLTQNNGKKFKNDVVILNSVSLLNQVFPYIHDYGYQSVHSWFDNDEAGKKASAILKLFLSTEHNLSHKPMNSIYIPFKDVNAWHMYKLEL